MESAVSSKMLASKRIPKSAPLQLVAFAHEADVRVALLEYTMNGLMPKADYADIGYARRLTIGYDGLFFERVTPEMDIGLWTTKFDTAAYLWRMVEWGSGSEELHASRTEFARYIRACERTGLWDIRFISLVFSMLNYYGIIRVEPQTAMKRGRAKRRRKYEALLLEARNYDGFG